MKNAYLAICYICNENCLFCPCSKAEKSENMVTDYIEIKKSVDLLAENGITDITISGGEPTLHPNLPLIVRYIQEKGISVTLLSNGERFCDNKYVKTFVNLVNIHNIKIITTLHSNIYTEHERANQTNGSFFRTLNGLLNLEKQGIRVIIKHCITKQNYKDLVSFYQFCDTTFPSTVDVQLCSIDYCGISKEELQSNFLPFTEIRPYLEELFDYHSLLEAQGGSRKLYCINIPLCACDVYYWNYMPKRRKKMYDAYKHPKDKEILNVSDNVGIDKAVCRDCKVKNICNGTYFTSFEAFGDKVVKPFS